MTSKATFDKIRRQDFSMHTCPICKSERSWELEDGVFYVARSNALVPGERGASAQHRLGAHNCDAVRKAVCLNCGFVALFKLGLGPREASP